jgi:HEPN domain-containing protein
MTPAIEVARRLIDLAKADRDAFLWLVQGKGLRAATVFFSAQQAIEKALKAVMTAKGLVPGRTHNLLALAAELNAAKIPTPFTPDELAILNPYAVTFRYDDEDLSLVTPEQARAMVGSILDWAAKTIDEAGEHHA